MIPVQGMDCDGGMDQSDGPEAMARTQAMLDRIALKSGAPVMAVMPNDPDGGLARRHMFRNVKERMDAPAFRFQRAKMVCADCLAQGSKSPRKYRTWTLLREHLIGYHGIDRREVPE